MGESQNNPLRMDFDRHIKLEFHGSIVTSDARLLADRELDDALGRTRTAASGLHHTRPGSHTANRPTASRHGPRKSRQPWQTFPAILGLRGRGLIMMEMYPSASLVHHV
jgi:hypothetical protein